MEEIVLNENAYHKTTNLGIYNKYTFNFYPKSYPSTPKKPIIDEDKA